MWYPKLSGMSMKIGNSILTLLMMVSFAAFSITLRMYRSQKEHSPTFKNIALFRLKTVRKGWLLSSSLWMILITLVSLLVYDFFFS